MAYLSMCGAAIKDTHEGNKKMSLQLNSIQELHTKDNKQLSQKVNEMEGNQEARLKQIQSLSNRFGLIRFFSKHVFKCW